jgi:hypothetical protein
MTGTSPFDAALQGMRETREQLRALRKGLEERVLGTSERRAAYEAERKHVAVLDALDEWDRRHAIEPAPARKRPLWAFWRRRR